MALAIDRSPRKAYLMSPVSWKVIHDYVVHTQIPYCTQERFIYTLNSCDIDHWLVSCDLVMSRMQRLINVPAYSM